MAIGLYGTVRPADVSIDDIEVFYTYVPDRETQTDEVLSLVSSDVLDYSKLPLDDRIDGNENILEGLYNLTLPATTFNQLGIYTLYFKPKVEYAIVMDCSVLSSLPSVKGIVLDLNVLPAKFRENNAMQGYRIEYINSDGTKLRNVSRFVVSSNKVVPVNQNIGSTVQNATRYRFDDSGSLLFLQLTPSSTSDVKPNVQPFIGTPGQTILISNTNFNPLVLEVDLVENTIDSLSDIIAGEQIKDINKGILTYYDKNRVIVKQFDLFTVQDDITRIESHEVKEKRTNIDDTQEYNNIVDNLQ